MSAITDLDLEELDFAEITVTDAPSPFFDELVSKVHTVATTLWNYSFGLVGKLFCVSRDSIRNVIRDLYFYPLNVMWIFPSFIKKMKREEQCYNDFWDTSKAGSPFFEHLKEVRDHFKVVKDEVEFKMGDKTLKLPYHIIRTKENAPQYKNVITVNGNLTINGTNVADTYPFLVSYIKGKYKEPIQFININQYGFKERNDKGEWVDYKPDIFDHASLAAAKAIEQIHAKYGEISLLRGHSFGGSLLADARTYLANKGIYARVSNYDRTLSSVYEVSKGYWGGRILLYPVAYILGWDINASEKFDKLGDKEIVVITAVEDDHYFADGANLVNIEKIKELQKIGKVQRLIFNPFLQICHPKNQHNLSAGALTKDCLIDDPNLNRDFINDNETMSDALLRHALAC